MQTPRTHTKWWGFLQHYWINSSDVWYVYGQCWKKTVYVLMQLFIFYNGKNFGRSLLIGDPKETYYIGPIEDTSIAHLNQWPSEGMAFLCIHFIRNRCCILICGWFVFTQAWLEMFFWQGHFRITAKLETYNEILILETTVSFISLSICLCIPCYRMCTISLSCYLPENIKLEHLLFF